MAPGTDFYLDRFEGDTAILLSGEITLAIPRSLLPTGASEGDYLTMSLTIDNDSRSNAQREISDLQQRLSSGENSNGQ